MMLIRFVLRIKGNSFNVTCINDHERQDMLEEMLGVVSAPADDALGTSGMPLAVSRTAWAPFVDAPTNGCGDGLN